MVGDSVAIVGSGPIGLFCVALAKVMGATTVFATDVSDYRLSLAKTAGADYVLNSDKSDVVSEIREITGGLGAGIVFETSGNVKAINRALKCFASADLT